jgi:hypothetical protein
MRFSAPRVLRCLVFGLFLACGVAQSAIVPLLPHLATRYALSDSETALLLAVPGLATLTVSVPAGVAADRYGARRVTLCAGLLLSVSCVAQAGQSLVLLMAGRIAFGIAFGIVWTTGVAWLAVLDDGAPAGVVGRDAVAASPSRLRGGSRWAGRRRRCLGLEPAADHRRPARRRHLDGSDRPGLLCRRRLLHRRQRGHRQAR